MNTGEVGGSTAISKEELRARGRQVANDATVLGQSMAELLRETYTYTEGLMRERPYMMLAAAAGAGYVLGGGLGSRFTASIVAIGGRLLARNLASRALAGAVMDVEEHPLEQ